MWQKLAISVAVVMPLIGCAGSINTSGGAVAPAPAVATQAGQSSVFGDAASTYTLFSVDGRTLPYARASHEAGLAPAVILSGSLLLQPNGVFSMSTTYREALASGQSARIALQGKQYSLAAIRNSNHPVHLIGYVDYMGIGGVTYRTAFARQYRAPLGRFIPSDNPDYEYEE